jgi:hypothetical protein
MPRTSPVRISGTGKFTDLASLLAATTDTSAGAVIRFDAADTLTLTGVTKALISANAADFKLHA